MPASVTRERLRMTLSEWFRIRCRPLPLVLGAAVLVGPYLTTAQAEGPFKPGRQAAKAQAGSRQTPADTDQEPEPTSRVKLNYLAAPWEKVLREVAEETGSQLVADRVPSGRFTRRDGAEYSRADAVRIINREIEPHGFRVIEKGNFLIVLDLPSQRPRYQAPIIPKPTNEAPRMETVNPITPQANTGRQFDRITPRAAQPPAHNSGIRQASHEVDEIGASRRSAASVFDEEAAQAPINQPMTVVVFRARNQRVSDLAKQLYRTFKPRAELVEHGRNDLPAFRVRGANPSNADTVQFAVAIDEAREELLIDARQTEADAMLKLLRRLDTAEPDAQPLQLVSTTKTVCQVAGQLPAVGEKIRAGRAQAPPKKVFPADDPLADAFAQIDAQAQPPGQPLPPGQSQMVIPKGQVGDIVGNLKAEVIIESVPDLGVLILKGNQGDLEQVMRVIKELEELSEQTAPIVHLLYLDQVNSEALAELLTTVYEKLTEFPGRATQPRQSVAILPVSKPNAILIVAPKNDLPAILELAKELDQKVDPETEFQVFRLQSAIAPQIETMITEFYTDRVGLDARPIVRSDVRTNSVIVSASPRDLDEIGTLIRKMDQDEIETVSKLEIFPLKNAVASELAAIINAAIQSVLAPPQNQGANQAFGGQGGFGGAQVDESFRDVKGGLLQFKAVDADGERLLKSGILADIRVTPDPRINALLVSAPEASLSLIGALIKQLDTPTSAVAEIKVFTLTNADPQLMVQQLQGLFNAQVVGQQGGGGQQRTLQQGFQVAGAEDASSGLIPIRFSIDTRTNSVIAVGSADALRVVEAILLRLDENDIRERQNTVYRLKNSPAQTIATAITTFMTGQRDITQQDPNLFSTVEQLEREVIVVAETVSNSLLISATPRYNDEILKLVKKLDEPPAQVIIQALIVEVELQDTDEFGIELGFQDSILFDRSIVDAENTYTTQTTTTQNNTTVTQTNIISQVSDPGFLFGNPSTPLGNNTGATNPGRVGSQGLSNFSLGRVNGDLGFGGLVLSASSQNVSMLLRALAANRQVRVLSRPQIRTMDNQVASIQQGQNVPIVQGVALAANGVASPNVQRDDSGVILTVQPRITPDGNIVMALTAEKSQYDLNNGVPIFTDAATGNVVTSPVKNISTANTTIMIPNGQTVVMGGLITSRSDESHRKVPWLGDIPVLGYMFRYDYQQTTRTELLIFLTPRIITDDCEAETIKEIEMARMHFIESEAEEIHGPLRGVPEQDWLGSEHLVVPGGSMELTVPPLPPGAILEPTPTKTPAPPQPDPKLQPVTPADAVPKPISPPPPTEGEAQAAPPFDEDMIVDPNVTPVGAVRLGGTKSKSAVQAAVAEFETQPVATKKKSVPAMLPKSGEKPAAVRLGRKPIE